MNRTSLSLTAGLLVAASTTLSSGCAFDEGFAIADLRGTISVPRAAATRTFVDADGAERELTDVRWIGPVYMGLFPSVEVANVHAPYPHPEVGPLVVPGALPATQPYGGTTVGDFRDACYESLFCEVVSGRFETFDSILEWFEMIGDPVRDGIGNIVTDAEAFRQECFDLFDVTDDSEIRITAFEDRNDDGLLDALDLDFVENGDMFTAEFTLWQQEHFYNRDQEGCEPGVDCDAFQLWGWMDAPSLVERQFGFSTCREGTLFRNEYTIDYQNPTTREDLLNRPSAYIQQGDWVSSQSYEWKDVLARPDLVLDLEVQ